jgi:hypothetical protein
MNGKQLVLLPSTCRATHWLELTARGTQLSNHPPSTSTVVPVANSFSVTNMIAFATSSGAPMERAERVGREEVRGRGAAEPR